MARRIYMRNGVGVGWLTKAYSGAARRGCAPNRREYAARGTIRNAIHQLEKLKVITKGKNGCVTMSFVCLFVLFFLFLLLCLFVAPRVLGCVLARLLIRSLDSCISGRIVSKTGRRDLDRIASQLKNVKVRKPVAVPGVPAAAAAAPATTPAPVKA